MSLFQVPGWSVPSAPVPDELGQSSKKRKRPHSTDPHKLESAQINIEKLTSKLKHISPEVGVRENDRLFRSSEGHSVESGKKKHKKKSSDVQKDSVPQQSSPSKEATDSGANKSQSTLPPKKKAKSKHPESLPTKTSPAANGNMPSSMDLTTLQKRLKDKLEGARFRLINEDLYKSDSRTAHQMMRDDPKIFEEYHAGFRHQVLSWPKNPVQHYVSLLESYPTKTVIADLGCGDALLARSLVPKGINVISFDLVSDGEFVVEADICEKIPLPGSEGDKETKSSGEGQIVDVVVCALSLMGVNWPTCLREAWRILKPGGELHVAEVTSRFKDLEGFLNLVGSLGFRLKAKDESNTHFILFEFVKISRVMKTDSDWAKILSRGHLLKPCEYKRR